MIIKLQKENQILKAENLKFKKNYHKSLNKEISPTSDNKK